MVPLSCGLFDTVLCSTAAAGHMYWCCPSGEVHPRHQRSPQSEIGVPACFIFTNSLGKYSHCLSPWLPPPKRREIHLHSFILCFFWMKIIWNIIYTYSKMFSISYATEVGSDPIVGSVVKISLSSKSLHWRGDEARDTLYHRGLRLLTRSCSVWSRNTKSPAVNRDSSVKSSTGWKGLLWMNQAMKPTVRMCLWKMEWHQSSRWSWNITRSSRECLSLSHAEWLGIHSQRWAENMTF